MELVPSKASQETAEREQKPKRYRAPGHGPEHLQRPIPPIRSEETHGQLPEPWKSLQRNGLAAQRARGIGGQEQFGGAMRTEKGEEEGRRNAFELPRA